MPRRPHPLTARAIAILAALAWLVGGALGLHHQADVAHVRDPLTGAVLHGYALAGAHVESQQPDVHGRADDTDAESAPCALDAALHQAAHALTAPPLGAAPTPATRAPGLAPATAPTRARAAILRVAPKTSPPARA